MKKIKKISRTNLPSYFNITNTILIAFLLYFFDAIGIIWGIFITIEVLLFIAHLYINYNTEYIDIIEKENKNNK